ncbi:MAG: NTF2-like N-terminal transpeptidase domain-containing protein [Patescibacteria group bacterium]
MKSKHIFIVLSLFLMASVTSGCATNIVTTAPASNQTNTVTQPSNEDQIKETISNYYSLICSSKFGEAYKYISSKSNISQKDYVDAKTEDANLVNGVKEISYNYINIASDKQSAEVNATITFTVMPLVSNISENSSAHNIKLSYEDNMWKIIWSKE